MQSSKRNEHPACGCKHCKLGASTEAGKSVHRQVNRKIRHAVKAMLRTMPFDLVDAVIVSTPYTD